MSEKSVRALVVDLRPVSEVRDVPDAELAVICEGLVSFLVCVRHDLSGKLSCNVVMVVRRSSTVSVASLAKVIASLVNMVSFAMSLWWMSLLMFRRVDECFASV